MLSVVLDASSLVGALLRKGSVPAQAFERAQKIATIVMSPETKAEIIEVVLRPKFNRFVSLNDVAMFLSALSSGAILFEPTIPVTDCRDPKDNKYLELALAAGAAVIVSSDADLLVLHPWRGINILTPAEFVARFT